MKQLAFHKLKGRPGVTYESAQTRKFLLGRTEVIRAASSQSKAWVDAMVDPRATVRMVLIISITLLSSMRYLYAIRTLNAQRCSMALLHDM